jgi:drug/metabolite transporter (DMT)-like permease
VLAIGMLLAGQAWLAGELGTVALGAGETMILAATLLWSVEVVFVKRLLGSLASPTLAAARMGVGTVLLLAWLAVTGRGGDLWALSADQWSWALLTGGLLAAYVGTWYAALARAQAVDVTAVLVFGAVVTATLARIADGASFDAVGLTAVTLGTVLAVYAALRARARPAPA